jgi:hypothetical protein
MSFISRLIRENVLYLFDTHVGGRGGVAIGGPNEQVGAEAIRLHRLAIREISQSALTQFEPVISE